MPITKIVIDDKTQAKQLTDDKIQVNLIAYPLNEENQKEPDAELKLFINSQLLQNITSDLQGNINESLIIHGNGGEIIIKLQDISSEVKSNIKTVLLISKEVDEKTNTIDKSDNIIIIDKEKYIAQLKINPSYITSLDEQSRNDKEIVRYALEQNGLLLQYTGENVKDDKNIVMIALDNNTSAFAYASDILKTNEVFILDCIKKY